MAFVDELKAVFIVIGRSVRDFFDHDAPSVGRYVKFFGMSIALLLAGAGSYIGYRAYVVSQEQAVYRSFSEYFDAYEAAQKANTMQEWERIVQMNESAYQKYKGRKSASLFLVLKSDAQMQLGQRVESINTLQQAIETIASNSPLLPLLKTKQALMQLDADEALSKVGLAQLVALARDEKNSMKDMALFYLGRYYWANDQIEEAQKAWQELEDSSWAQKAYPSPWVSEAKHALQQLTA